MQIVNEARTMRKNSCWLLHQSKLEYDSDMMARDSDLCLSMVISYTVIKYRCGWKVLAHWFWIVEIYLVIYAYRAMPGPDTSSHLREQQLRGNQDWLMFKICTIYKLIKCLICVCVCVCFVVVVIIYVICL